MGHLSIQPHTCFFIPFPSMGWFMFLYIFMLGEEITWYCMHHITFSPFVLFFVVHLFYFEILWFINHYHDILNLSLLNMNKPTLLSSRLPMVISEIRGWSLLPLLFSSLPIVPASKEALHPWQSIFTCGLIVNPFLKLPKILINYITLAHYFP